MQTQKIICSETALSSALTVNYQTLVNQIKHKHILLLVYQSKCYQEIKINNTSKMTPFFYYQRVKVYLVMYPLFKIRVLENKTKFAGNLIVRWEMLQCIP